MRNELNQIEEIENYLEGKMGEADRMVFESRMNADENLRNNVLLQEQLTQRIKVNAFRNEILNFHTAYTETATVRSGRYRFYLNTLLLFGVVGLVAVSVYFFYPWKETQKHETALNETPGNTLEVLPVQQNNDNLVSGTTVVAEKNPNEPATAVRPDPSLHKKQKTKERKEQEEAPFVREEKTLPPPPADESPCRNFYLSTHTEKIDASVGGDVVTQESGSVIHFPGGIMTDQEGNVVKGEVEIKYREYRNAAQMAFSGIPMVYNEGGKKFQFNSAGMFDIRAYQNGKELKIKPGAAFKVDYNVTEQKDSCYFFALDDKTKTWKKINPIQFVPPAHHAYPLQSGNNPQGNGQIFIRVTDAVSGTNISDKVFVKFLKPAADLYTTNIPIDSGYTASSIVRGTYDMEISSELGYRKLKLKEVKVFEGRITYIEARLTPPRATKNALDHLFQRKRNLNDYAMRPSNDRAIKLPPKQDGKINLRTRKSEDTKGKYIAEISRDSIMGYSDAGHYSPELVQGLRCESFGIYNCDQIYVLRSPIDVKASYKTAMGENINDGYVISMIDLAYNGAFSFDPAGFTCSRSGNNVILLFTRSKKLYALPSDDFKKMNLSQSGDYTFTMTDITSEVKDPEDLRKYLRLKK